MGGEEEGLGVRRSILNAGSAACLFIHVLYDSCTIASDSDGDGDGIIGNKSEGVKRGIEILS